MTKVSYTYAFKSKLFLSVQCTAWSYYCKKMVLLKKFLEKFLLNNFINKEYNWINNDFNKNNNEPVNFSILNCYNFIKKQSIWLHFKISNFFQKYFSRSWIFSKITKIRNPLKKLGNFPRQIQSLRFSPCNSNSSKLALWFFLFRFSFQRTLKIFSFQLSMMDLARYYI